MASTLPANLVTTERQALVFLAQVLQSLSLTDSSIVDGEVSFEAAITIIAGALVNAGAAALQPGTFGSMSLSPQGRLRVETQESVGPMVMAGPWSGASPW